MRRLARDLNERERRQVIDAVNAVLRAERETGISAKETARILAGQRASSKRSENRGWAAA